MPRTAVITDPKHPDFPHHGTENGRRYGCTCDDCVTAAYRAGKVRRGHLMLGIRRRADPELRRRCRQHVTDLMAMHPGHTIDAINRAAGLPETLLRQFMKGVTDGIFIESAKAILAVTPDRIQPSCHPADDARLLIGQMQALGYSMRWQKEQTGIDVPKVWATPYPTVRAYVFEGIKALHARVGDRQADAARDGLRPTAITQAKTYARRNGYYPPAFYDDDGTLDHRAIPEHPWSINDEKAHFGIEMLRAVVKHHGTLPLPEIAALVGQNVRQVERVVDKLGLHLHERRRPKRIAWLREQLHRFDMEATDPVLFALEVGLYPIKWFVRDHPGVVAWKERVAAKEAARAAEAAARAYAKAVEAEAAETRAAQAPEVPVAA